MRRIGAFVAAALLALSLGSAVVGASSRSSLNADFEAWMDGVVVGHITIRTAGLLGGPGDIHLRGNLGAAWLGCHRRCAVLSP
jgi:H+/gluconate symporter-like permease